MTEEGKEEKICGIDVETAAGLGWDEVEDQSRRAA